MSVHKAITKHVNTQNQRITEFLQLDQQREHYIEEAISLCKQGMPFTTDQINDVTDKINQLAKQGIIPSRKKVTIEMVHDYLKQQNK